MTGRQRLLKRLDEAWSAFKDSYAGEPDSRLLEAGATGDWSVKDILAHVTTWKLAGRRSAEMRAEGDGLPLGSPAAVVARVAGHVGAARSSVERR